jgi:hypothetical protein
MRKILTALALVGGLAVFAGGSTSPASASTVLHAPQERVPAVTQVQYPGGYGEGPRHRFRRHEMWRRHMMHERWRAEHGYRRGPGY